MLDILCAVFLMSNFIVIALFILGAIFGRH